METILEHFFCFGTKQLDQEISRLERMLSGSMEDCSDLKEEMRQFKPRSRDFNSFDPRRFPGRIELVR